MNKGGRMNNLCAKQSISKFMASMVVQISGLYIIVFKNYGYFSKPL